MFKPFTPSAIAFTMNHGIGLMSEEEQEPEMRIARQLHAHHVAPLLLKIESLEARPSAATPEPPPTPTDGPSIHDLVIPDLIARKAFGLDKYNTILQAHNGRDPLLDAYQEALDLVVYLKQEMIERKALLDRNAELERQLEAATRALAIPVEPSSIL